MEEYEKHKQKIREQRERFISEIQKNSLEIEDMLTTFHQDSINTMVSWHQMKLVKINEEFIVNSKVKFVKFFQDEKTMKFTSYLKKGGTYGLQKHDCIETILVLQGSLRDMKMPEVVYTKGNVITYKKGQLHKPYTTEPTVVQVTFTK